MARQIKLEKDFESLLMSSASAQGYHVIPIPDDNKKSQAAGNLGAASRASAKPYDFGLLKDGCYYAVECKMVKDATLYHYAVKPHQREGLAEVSKCGGLALLAIYFKFKSEGEVYEKGVILPYVPSTLNFDYNDFNKDRDNKKWSWKELVRRGDDFDLSSLPATWSRYRKIIDIASEINDQYKETLRRLADS